MKPNEILHAQIMDFINNQIKSNDPPETKQTLERLIKEGYIDTDTKKFIGQCVAVEIFNVLKYQKSFDKSRYVRNLVNLPKEPFEK